MTTNRKIELFSQAYKRWLRGQANNEPEAFCGAEPRASEYGLAEFVAEMCRAKVRKEMSV